MMVLCLLGFFNFRGRPSKFVKSADNEKEAEKRGPPPKMDLTESLRAAKKELAQIKIRMATYAAELDE